MCMEQCWNNSWNSSTKLSFHAEYPIFDTFVFLLVILFGRFKYIHELEQLERNEVVMQNIRYLIHLYQMMYCCWSFYGFNCPAQEEYCFSIFIFNISDTFYELVGNEIYQYIKIYIPIYQYINIYTNIQIYQYIFILNIGESVITFYELMRNMIYQ